MATRTVSAGQSIQSTIDQSQPGDVISIEAGASFAQSLTLTNKNSDTPITIQSSRASELPPDMQPDGLKMPKIVTPKLSDTISDRALRAAPGAHHWKLIGLDFAQDPARDVRTLVEIGDPNQTSLDAIPHSITMDRCLVHGASDKESQRGIGLNARAVDILNCRIYEIHGIGYDTQAICGWNGIGQYRIINNYLEAAGENLMFGGADPAIKNLVAEGIEIRRNTLRKPKTWKVGDPSYKGIHWTVKNLLEIKAGKKIVIDGNVFEGNWVDAQTGWAILLKVQNQDGTCELCVSEDIDFTNNIVRDTTHGLNVLAYDPYKGSAQLKNVRVINNLWLVNGGWFQGTGSGKLPDGSPALDGADGMLLEHNTHIQVAPFFTDSQNTMNLYGGPTKRFVYRNNLGTKTGYGIKGDGTGEGKAAFAKFTPDAIIEANVLAGADANVYPANNFYPKTWAEVQLGTDHKLASTSPFKSKGTDGKDPGADMDAIAKAMSGSVSTPVPQPVPPQPPQPASTNTPSPDGTEGPTVTDSEGAVWTLGPDNRTLRNGKDVGGAGKKYLYWQKTVYLQGMSDGWFKWTGIEWKWNSPNRPPAPVLVVQPTQPTPPQPTQPVPHAEIENATWDWPSADPAARYVFLDTKWREGWFTVPSGSRLWGWRRKL